MSNYMKNWSIRMKIMSLALLLELFLVVGSGYGWIALNNVGKELESIVHIDIPLTKNIALVTEKQLERALYFERAVRYGELILHKSSAVNQMQASIKAFHQLEGDISKEFSEAGQLIEQSLLHAATPEQLLVLEKIKSDFLELSEVGKQFGEHAESVFSLLEKGDIDAVEAAMDKMLIEEEHLVKGLENLLLQVEGFTEDAGKMALAHEQDAIKVLTIIVLVAIALGLIISHWLAGLIVKPLRDAITTASGDLSADIHVTSTDETGELLTAINGMRLKLLDMLGTISSTTDQLSAAAEELSVVSSHTCESVQEQKAETEQVAAAMNEMTTTVQGVAENISDTADAANEADIETETGRKIVGKTVEEIELLSLQINEAAEVISQLDKDSENINTVLSVIQGIAEQTNLLALNAAIEAARAGEQGRGFAVVADEVRTLAGRTQQSTEEIKQMIERLQSGSRKSVQVMNSSRDQTVSVVAQANQAEESLGNIAGAVSKINVMSSQIATASEEQGAVAEEINRNVLQINTMADTAAQGISQISGASSDLARMANELRSTVDQFKT